MLAFFQNVWNTIELIASSLWNGITAVFSLVPKALAVMGLAELAIPDPLVVFALVALHVGLVFLVLKLTAMLL